MHDWFVCPTVSMVTTSHATGTEKTLSRNLHIRAVVFSMDNLYLAGGNRFAGRGLAG